jgi:hypothetical protein
MTIYLTLAQIAPKIWLLTAFISQGWAAFAASQGAGASAVNLWGAPSFRALCGGSAAARFRVRFDLFEYLLLAYYLVCNTPPTWQTNS